MFFSTIYLILASHQVPNATEMARLIQNVSESESVDAVVIAQLVVVESRGNPLAVNWKTGDFGLMQVNLKSHPNVKISCAMNAECGLRAGIKIYKSTHRPCAYNLGNAKLTARRMQKCLLYESKLANVIAGVK